MDSESQPASSEPLSGPSHTTPKSPLPVSSPVGCCRCHVNTDGRSLIICLDGILIQNSTVFEFYNQIKRSQQRLVYYDSEAGFYAGSSRLKRLCNSASDAVLINITLKNVILRAYRWLSDQYKVGDRIYLFGFSRGAYLVRALATMIKTVGLVYPLHMDMIPEGYRRYVQDNPETFKTNYSITGACVHFVGVWDTVFPVGLLKPKTLPLAKSCEHICFFRQALALDERGSNFLPVYVEAYESHPSSVKEVWFAGTHFDLGVAGERAYNVNLAHVPLLWMYNEVMMAGLDLEESNIKLTWAALKNSRPKCSRHGRSRLIQRHQLIHASVAFKSRSYKPTAGFSSEFGMWDWTALIGRRTIGEISWPADWNNILEMHLFGPSAVEIAVVELRQGILQDVCPLSVYVTVWSWDGGKTILQTYKALRNIINILAHDNPQARIGAAYALSRLSHDADARIKMIDLDAVRKLAQHLEDDDSGVKTAVISAFRALAQYGDARSKIIEMQPIPTFIDLLEHGDSGLKTTVASALAALAYDRSARINMIHLGTFQKLAQCLENGDIEIRTAVASAFHEFAQHDDTRSKILETDAISTLVPLLELDDASLKVAVMSALASLVHDLNPRIQITDAVPKLTELLTDGDSDVKTAAACALHELAQYGDTRCKIIKTQAVPMLVLLLEYDDPDLKAAVTKALATLAQEEQAQAIMVATRALPIFASLLNNGEPDIMIVIANALPELVLPGSGTCTEMLKTSMISILAGLLNHSDSDVKSSVVKALAKLAEDDPVRHAILNTQAIPRLTCLLKDRNSRVRSDATNALRLLGGHEDARSAIKRASFVDVDND